MKESVTPQYVTEINLPTCIFFFFLFFTNGISNRTRSLTKSTRSMRPVIRDSPRGSSIYVLDIANATKIYSGPWCPTHGGRYHACNTGMIKLDHDAHGTAAKRPKFPLRGRALENDKMESVCGIISGAYEFCIPSGRAARME